MVKKISKTEKDRRWLALQKNKMQERISKGLPVFDGRLVRTPNLNLQYGEKPDVEPA